GLAPAGEYLLLSRQKQEPRKGDPGTPPLAARGVRCDARSLQPRAEVAAFASLTAPGQLRAVRSRGAAMRPAAKTRASRRRPRDAIRPATHRLQGGRRCATARP